jgi:hypothetical protein
VYTSAWVSFTSLAEAIKPNAEALLHHCQALKDGLNRRLRIA